MDPNANLQEQERIIARANAPESALERRFDISRLHDLREALADWLRHGGFAPDWAKAPRAARFYGFR